MQRWTQAQFEALAAGAQTLSADEHGAKVLLTPDDQVIKLFRRKRLLSSAWIDPYARRFERAAQRLAALGIPAAQVELVARVPSMSRDIVVYPHLPGRSLRAALANGSPQARERLLLALASLLAKLHRHGVNFRAAHFGNFVVRDERQTPLELGLIDISEARFHRAALSPTARARNFRPLTRYVEDLAAVQHFGIDRFIGAYLEYARLTHRDVTRFHAALRKVHAAFAEGRGDV